MINGTSECSKPLQNIVKLYKQSRLIFFPKDLETVCAGNMYFHEKLALHAISSREIGV